MQLAELSAALLLLSSACCVLAREPGEAAAHGAALLEASSHAAQSPAVASSEDAGSLPSFDLMIIIPSHGRLDADRRMAIRQSWAQYFNTSVNCTSCLNHSAKLLFVTGTEGDTKKIEAESSKFGDIGALLDFGQFRFDEGNAEKTQRSIRFALEHFKFRLLLKVDMDSWVFVDRLVEFLEREHLFDYNASLPGVYAGNFDRAPDVALTGVEARGQDWKDPPHAEGAGYILTPDLCEFIAGMGAPSEDMSGAPKWGDEYGWAPVPRLWSLPKEDSSVGLWLEPVNHTKLSMPVSARNVACDGTDSDVINHETVLIDRYVQPDQMQRRWNAYLKTGDPCSQVDEYRHWWRWKPKSDRGTRLLRQVRD